MIRLIAVALLLPRMMSTAQAQLPVAPPPREIRDDGTRDPVPAPEVAKKEDPLKVVERIIKNSQDVGEKLAKTDTGTDTQKTQDKILKDIDALLKQDDPPPMSDKDKDQDKEKNNDKSDMNDKKDMKSDMNDKKDMPMGKGDMPPPKNMDMNGNDKGMGMGEQPMGGDQPKERRPRQGDQKQEATPKDPGKGSPKDKQPMGSASNDPKSPSGGKPDNKGGKMSNTVLPFEDDVVKEVWGHLPDKLRQQASQYYKEEIVARYSDLLKMYYASLSEKK